MEIYVSCPKFMVKFKKRNSRHFKEIMWRKLGRSNEKILPNM